MDSYRVRLLLTAAALGAVVLSASALAEGQLSRREAAPETEALPAAAPARYYAALRLKPEVSPEGLSLQTEDGGFLEAVAVDADGDAALGPLLPGRYRLCRDGESLGSFSMEDNAALTASDGLLWADGELLWLCPSPPASLELWCEAARPGAYVLTVETEDGELRDQVVVVSAGGTSRCAFGGLPAGRCRVLQNGACLMETELTPGPAAPQLLTLRSGD